MTANRSALKTLVCCGILASSGPAFAQEGEDAPAPAEPTDPSATPPDGTTPPAADPAADPAAAPAGRWPRSVIARPLTLPGGLAQAGGDIIANNDFSGIRMNLAGGYGITDDLEVNGFYLFTLKDFEIKGSLDVDVGYKILRGAAGGKLEVIGRGRIGYDIAGELINPLRLGPHVQYNVTDKIALITPGQHLVIELDSAATVPPAPEDPKSIFFQMPVAVGFQATPELYLQLDTTLFSIKIKDSANAFIFADSTPLAVTAIYNAIPALDAIATIGLNLTPPEVPMVDTGVGDTLTFLIGARYYIGQL